MKTRPSLTFASVLQSDVWPQASLMEGASSSAGRFRGPSQKRAVGNADWPDPSAPLPAGRRSHLLQDGPGEHIEAPHSLLVLVVLALNDVMLCADWVRDERLSGLPALRLRCVWVLLPASPLHSSREVSGPRGCVGSGRKGEVTSEFPPFMQPKKMLFKIGEHRM